MATVTGIYQNTSYLGKAFPRLWSMVLWCASRPLTIRSGLTDIL